jgi:hypothetical protein
MLSRLVGYAAVSPKIYFKKKYKLANKIYKNGQEKPIFDLETIEFT